MMSLGKSAKKGKSDKKGEVAESTGLKPTRANSAYIYFSGVTIKKLKDAEGLSHKDAFA